LLKQLNISPGHIKRIIVALYEAEVNVVAHSNGGSIECGIEPDEVSIVVADTGPGIPDLELAMTEGWSTATVEVREMGFGAGMGLSNIRKHTDELSIDTGEGKPTTISMRFVLDGGFHG
jgi:anti-sigma regulatory factor (Ser/Thr protein kinase)